MNKINEDFDVAQFYADFLTQGFAVFDGSEILQDIVFEPFEALLRRFPNAVATEDRYEVEFKPTEEDLQVLELVRSRIYASPLFTENDILKYHFLDYRVNFDVVKWHNDAANRFATHNATVNCFFDDMDESKGGRFDVMRYNRDVAQKTVDHPDMGSVYPKKFMIVVFNQNRNFMHKVQHTMHLRRMMSFAAGFSGFNELTVERE